MSDSTRDNEELEAFMYNKKHEVYYADVVGLLADLSYRELDRMKRNEIYNKVYQLVREYETVKDYE